MRLWPVWFASEGVEAALKEGTGISAETSFEALTEVGIRLSLAHGWQVKQIKVRKTDVGDSVCLARPCQFGLANLNMVPKPALPVPGKPVPLSSEPAKIPGRRRRRQWFRSRRR